MTSCEVSFLGELKPLKRKKMPIVSGSNGCPIPGSKMFFGHEILNVEFSSEAKTDSGNNQDYGLDRALHVEKFQPYRRTLRLDDDEDDEEYVNFVVIDEFHEKFGPAVMHIKKQRVIGLGADGVEVFKNGRLCWLQIATKNKVYLFDILLLGTRAFKNGLSMILENKHILKVCHDCRAIAGCLIAQFGVKLTNVFDTQVADVMCFYSETGGFLPDRVSTLQEVVSLYLKVPSSQLLSLQMKAQLSKEERDMWQKRPCALPLLKVMSLSVVHLQPLRLVLMDTLMTDYMTLVDSYLNSSHYQPDELDHVAMESVLQLPRELRQLEEMRCERQEWAAKHYPVTEQGLLSRFSPRNQSSPQTSPAAREQSQTQADSLGPVTEESTLLTTKEDPLLHKTPTSSLRVTSVSSVDVHNSPQLPAQAPVPAALSNLRQEMSVNKQSLGIGRGRTEVLLDALVREKPLEREQSSITALPAIGRGFLLQIPQTQIPGQCSSYVETPGMMATGPSSPSHKTTKKQ